MDLEKWSDSILVERRGRTERKMIEQVRDAVIEASTTFRQDQIDAYKKAIRIEKNEKARWALECILRNAEVAKKKHRYPLCNDTGTPHVYVEMGTDVNLFPGFYNSILEGIKRGLRDLPARPMAVKGRPIERITQKKGLYDDPGQLVPGPFLVEPVSGDKVHITVMMLGGGPELRAKTYRIYHLKNAEKVFKEAAGWAIEEVGRLGCTPCVPAIGIGRTHFEATAFMLRALRHGRFDRHNEWEREIVDLINATGIGPIGLGGKTTALGAFVQIGPQRASGARIVCMRLGCCYDPRKATVTLSY